MFSPLAFPTGLILFNLCTSVPPASHVGLSPFELYREPLIVIAIADGSEMGLDGTDKHGLRGNASNRDRENGMGMGQDLEKLLAMLEDLERQYPSAIVQRILLFDYVQNSLADMERIMVVPPPKASRTTTMKTVMCDLTASILAEMTTYAKTLQGLESIDSPTISIKLTAVNGHLWPSNPPDSWGQRDLDGSPQRHRSSSGSPASGSGRNRASMPVQLPSRMNGLAENARVTRPPSPTENAHNPPTTFDGISAAGHIPGSSNAASKPDPESAWRTQSRERVSTQGFGAGSLSERARNNGKARVGITIGALYLHAGRWPDAVREFVEGASVAKANSDYLWHAKALENILISLLMMAWAGMDFQVWTHSSTYGIIRPDLLVYRDAYCIRLHFRYPRYAILSRTSHRQQSLQVILHRIAPQTSICRVMQVPRVV